MLVNECIRKVNRCSAAKMGAVSSNGQQQPAEQWAEGSRGHRLANGIV